MSKLSRKSPPVEDSIIRREQNITDIDASRNQSALSGPMIPQFSGTVRNIQVSQECDVSHNIQI